MHIFGHCRNILDSVNYGNSVRALMVFRSYADISRHLRDTLFMSDKYLFL